MSTTATARTPRPDRPQSTKGKVRMARESSAPSLDRRAVVQREKEEYGGVKVGLAFFGWLTATGTAVMLATMLAAAGIVIAVATHTSASEASSQVGQDPRTVGMLAGVMLLVVLFVAYYCGGYVAGRMARFNGVRQGLAVWLWAVLTMAMVAVLAALAGSQYDMLSELSNLPRIPVSSGSLTTGGLIALPVAALGSLAGALTGGQAGMRFHRKVDKAGLGR
jgi:uncharacterized membrane protein YdbT with pleckstrin-like domain